MTRQGPNSGQGNSPVSTAGLRGAVDLGALAAAREAQARSAERKRDRVAGGGAVTVMDVTTADFRTEVVERSFEVPVVVDLWATWCGPCKQLSPLLEKLAEEDGGAWLLAKVDVDAEQQIAAAFQVQSVPTVIALIKGQPVPMFSGALPEAQVRQVIDELIKVARENGVVGGGQPADRPAEAVEPVGPGDEVSGGRYEAAYEAFEAGNWVGAEAEFEKVLAEFPGDEEATAGVYRSRLMARTDGVDPEGAIARSDAAPSDVEAAAVAADIDLLAGRVSDAFQRLIESVRLTSGDDRNRARECLLELFAMVGDDDPSVRSARLALANALY